MKKQNWIQMRETAAASPLFKAASEPYLEFYPEPHPEPHLILYRLLQLQLDTLYIKPIKT
jgi:hypothetical protein